MSIVWVVSANITERALSVAQLAQEGFEARGFESLADLFAALVNQIPDALVIDTLDSGLDASKWEAIQILASSSTILLLTGAGAEPFPADAILPRPFSIGELVGKIRTLIK